MRTLFWQVLALAVMTSPCAATGNIGCLFSEELCRSDLEWCFDDGAFGRCIKLNDPRNPQELHRHQLSQEELAILEGELEKLLELGYRWRHRHTQCLLKALLYAFENGTPLDASICHSYKGADLPTTLESSDDDTEPLAFIKFTPSAGNQQSDYANEVYYPPSPREGMREYIPDDRADQEEDSPTYVVRKSLGTHFSPTYNSPDNFRSGFEVKDYIPQEEEEPYLNVERPYAALRSLTSWPSSDEFEARRKEIDDFDPEKMSLALRNILRPSFALFKTPTNSYGNNDGDEVEFELENEKERILQYDDDTKGFTEGGTVYQEDNDSLPQLIDQLNGALGFKRRERLDVKKPGPPYDPAFQKIDEPPKMKKKANNLGETTLHHFTSTDKDHAYIQFEESIRSWMEGVRVTNSVAKLLHLPNGTLSHIIINHNIVAFKVNPKIGGMNASQVSKKLDDIKDEISRETGDHVISTGIGVGVTQKVEKPQKMMKKANPIRETTTPDYELIDTDFAYIQFEESVRAWAEGERILTIITKLLRLPNGTLSHLELDHNDVAFKVNPKIGGINASEVAKKMDNIKDQISRETGVQVISTGIGLKTVKLPTALRMNGHSDHEVYVVGVVVVGTLAAVTLSAVVFYLTKKHGHKLRQHVKAEGEPMRKLYQDLCRARMSTKTPNQQESAPAQRVTSLSKESDKDSPSSRSSTSSWSEDPALTNMDVATGQMVLSYMEEHLKNKERLESEWTALCAYEADPSATTIAQRPENLQKNRYPHALPYDHARVVLNELSNITSSDYINASTITDHDPRNPAYIVSQGPLPHTTPDLWQMVWEQGCVAMVMLTRLGEADSPLCFHYWPEEGSELYHVYEVHLVSEHIWCDDYLVRSFYLKNLKTGETRTVTQFHFMSWPEGGIPSSTKPLLEFRRKVNKSFRGRSCPIVVHCSDGVGRSGAYVLLDMVLNRIGKGAKEIDVGATLEHIRDQRAGAVATKAQFQFVLQAVADEVQAILKLLPQQP